MNPHFLQKGFFIDRLPSLENDGRCHRFAPAIMRQIDYGGLLHAGIGGVKRLCAVLRGDFGTAVQYRARLK